MTAAVVGADGMSDAGGAEVVDLGAMPTAGLDGAVWSLPHGGDLDANLVRLGPGGSVGEHINADVDVLLFVLCGSAELDIEGTPHDLHDDVGALVPRGLRRGITAGDRGVTYLTVHRRRDGLDIGRREPADTVARSAG